jgi:hypothetical protein
MTSFSTKSREGGCTCGKVRYRFEAEPMIVHCCHCTWCQRETGSAFVVNVLVETSNLSLLGDAPEIVDTPTASGLGQKIARCPDCKVAVWSHYPNAGTFAAFVRGGTLDDTSTLAPDVHIFTASQQHWLSLTDGKPAFPEFYSDFAAVWSEDARARWAALLALKAAQ